MSLLDMLTINEEPANRENLLETVCKAFDYFPENVWNGIKYLGNIILKNDVKIEVNDKLHRAFIFTDLLVKIKGIKDGLKSPHLLLAVTHDPVIAIIHRFESRRLKRIVNIIRDFVSEDVGVVSLFETEDDAVKITAHGLGHNKGLKHHKDPIDIMYARLLDNHPIRIDGFCRKCKRDLEQRAR